MFWSLRCRESLAAADEAHNSTAENVLPTASEATTETGRKKQSERELHAEIDTVEGRRQLLRESLCLLREALVPFARSQEGLDPSCLDDAFDYEFFSGLVVSQLPKALIAEVYIGCCCFGNCLCVLVRFLAQGTFSLVCLDIEFDHPLNHHLRSLQRQLKSTLSHQKKREDDEQDTKAAQTLINVRQGPASRPTIEPR